MQPMNCELRACSVTVECGKRNEGMYFVLAVQLEYILYCLLQGTWAYFIYREKALPGETYLRGI